MRLNEYFHKQVNNTILATAIEYAFRYALNLVENPTVEYIASDIPAVFIAVPDKVSVPPTTRSIQSIAIETKRWRYVLTNDVDERWYTITYAYHAKGDLLFIHLDEKIKSVEK